MSLNNVPPGKNVPDSFNVVIEIPMNADPIKYEVDKESGAIFVDRFMTTAMHYPTNYGYVPQTLSGDGDPVDVLVITPYPLFPGVVVPCRPLGILMMEDEAGVDGKVIAVPTSKILPMYDQWKTIDDVNAMLRNAIAHFFEHYKDLEKGKWVKVIGWEGIDSAKKEVMDGVANYQKSQAGIESTAATAAALTLQKHQSIGPGALLLHGASSGGHLPGALAVCRLNWWHGIPKPIYQLSCMYQI